MNINERVKLVRKYLNLTMEEFGKKISLAKTSISNIENGYREISERTIKDICREYNVNYNWLVNGEGDMFVKDDDIILDKLAEQYNLTNTQLRIARGYLKLDNHMREVFCEMLMEIVNEEKDDIE